MSLKQQLLDDYKQSIKNKDTLKKNTITMVRAAILQKEKDQKIILDDEDIIDIIASEVKRRKSSMAEFAKGNRPDIIENLEYEINVLQGYLPQQLSEDQVSDIVAQTIKELGANSIKDMGKVMGVLMPKLRGVADGKLINQLVKKYLQG